MGAQLRQTNFSAGELDPQVQGRSDLPVFGKGLKTCRNFVPLKTGPAMSRPGSTFVAQVKDVAAYEGYDAGDGPDRPVRLVPFVFSDEQAYVLELGERYIRFHQLGRTVESVPGTPYEVTTYTDAAGAVTPLPILAKDLHLLRFAQVGNLITIVAQGLPPLELKRNGSADWKATETSFAPPEPVLPDVGDSYFLNPFNPGAVPQNIITTPFVVLANSIGAESLADGRPKREWVHAFTAIMQRRSDGLILESKAVVVKSSHPDGTETWPSAVPALTALADQKFAIYPETPLKLKRLATAGAADPLYRTLGFRIYRGRGDLLGWIGDTRGREFVDVGQEPDYSVQPPLGFNPFVRPMSLLTLLERPMSVAFFQERRVFGGGSFITGKTQLSPGVWLGGDDIGRVGTLFLSATGDYYNFDERLAIHVAGEALTFELASRRREHIRHLVALERLVILTNSSVWTIGGQAGSPLDFNSVDARQNDDVGASHVTPVVIDGTVLFVRTKGLGARALVPQAADTPYAGFDLSENARHLVIGSRRAIVDWAYQEDPFGIVWAVRKDGALLSLTFDRGRQVVAWARHDSEAGASYGAARYESVCTVPEGEEDAVYVVVNRVQKGPAEFENVRVRYIERFTSRVRRVLETDGLPENVSVPGIDDTDTLYPTDVCLDCAQLFRGDPTRTLTGLTKLANKRVWVLARGMPPAYGDVNDDGELTISEQQWPNAPAANAVDENGIAKFVAYAGLLYECDLETLAVVQSSLTPKTISEVGFELDSSKGIKAGQSFAKLTTWKQRKVSDSFGVISAASELLYTPVPNAWDRTARVCLRQSLPLPVTVTGITREVE